MGGLDPARWEKVTLLFEEALSRAPAERAEYLSTASGDPEVRRAVEALLAADERPAAVLDASPAALAALAASPPGDDDTPEPPGRLVGPWRIVRELGRGGMGAVYLAERADDQYRKRVALKLVKRGMDTDEILRRFRRERQILASLEHPNIARVHDGGATDDGRPWLVMEYVEGERIDRYCDERKLDAAGRLRLVAAVCRAAEHAHRNRIVHRDIKPSNILVTADGDVRLLDFGIAKLLDDEAGTASAVTRTGRSVLTPAWASPEQHDGGIVTAASDVYALGLLVQELLSGERQGAPGARSLRGPLATIVGKATAAAPAARYQSAGELGLDLERYLAGLPIAARPPSPRERVRRLVARRPVGTALGAVAVIALAVAGGAAVLRGGGGSGSPAPVVARTLAVVPTAPDPRDSADAYLVHGVAEELSARLGRLRRLRVKSPRAVTATAASAGPDALGRLLGVNYLVESTVRRRDSLIDVALSLVDAGSGFQLWADDYAATAAGLLALEDSMVRDVAAAVAGELSAAERAALASRPSSSPAAYDHFLRGNYGLRARTPASVRDAIGEYGLAASLDNRFAEAVARQGYAYLLYLDWGWPFPGRTADELLTAGRSLAGRAMEIDPGSAEVWLTQAYLRVLDDPARNAGALDAFVRSLQLDSLNPEAQHQYGQTLMVLGRDQEAIAAYHRTLALEPGRPMTLVPIAAIYSNLGSRAEAKRWIDSAMAVAGSVPAPYALAVWADFTLLWGDAKAAEAAARRALGMDNSYPAPALAVLAAALAREGRAEEARATIERALATIDTVRPSPTDARFVAPALAAVGRVPDALALIERARPRGAQLWFYLRSRAFDPLRAHPRFQAVWRESDPRLPGQQRAAGGVVE